MPQLVGAGLFIALISFIGYVLIAGAVIIWPIFNILAYLKVLIFPRPIRKKYGTKLNNLSKISFDLAITETDHKDIKSHKKTITNLKDKLPKIIASLDENILELKDKISKLEKEISTLGNLKKNNDGSYSQRSNDGKIAYSLDEKIDKLSYKKYQLESEIKIAEEKNRDQIDTIKEKINIIKNKPWVEWNEWSARYARYLSNKNAIIFMFFGFPVFFACLAFFNSVTFMEILHLYTYISYIQPISDIFGIQNFNTGFSSNFISFEYATGSLDKHSGMFSFSSWIIYTLTMPLISFIVYYFSYSLKIKDTSEVEPAIY